MFSNPRRLTTDPSTLESIEKATLRSVTQAMFEFKGEAVEIFSNSRDRPQDVGEDATREALDKMGAPAISKRLFGTFDYKKARYLFLPELAMRQALFVDSKVEKDARTATLQRSQTSMEIHQFRKRTEVNERGTLPTVIDNKVGSYLVTTAFVKYDYDEVESGGMKLKSIFTVCVPNGLLQARYNPSVDDTIWMAGRNAETLGEEFRVRLSLRKLKDKAKWRVQAIDPYSKSFRWDE